VTTWQDDRPFDSRIVPRHFSVEALGNQSVSADVAIDTLRDSDYCCRTVPGDAADPGMTLRPFDSFWDHQEVRTFPDIPAIHNEMPKPPADMDIPRALSSPPLPSSTAKASPTKPNGPTSRVRSLSEFQPPKR